MPADGSPLCQYDNYLSLMQAIPGRTLPSRNSRDAPPAGGDVGHLVAKPSVLTAAAESPPPMMVVASVSARDLATAMVPFARVGFSNTPIGAVPDNRLCRLDFVCIQLSGSRTDVQAHPAVRNTGFPWCIQRSRSQRRSDSGKDFAQTESTGSRILTPLASA